MDLNQSNQLNAMQLLLNQVKMLQDQVAQLTSKSTQSTNVGNGRQVRSVPVEFPVQPMLSTGAGMDLRTMMATTLQGMNGVPSYGASNLMEGTLQGVNVVSSMMEGNSCLWATGIPDEFRNTQILYNIFGSYGNVMKIKFSRKKPDGALIEMQDPKGAAMCCKYLHDVKLPGGRMSVKASKFPKVVIYPSENDDLGKDFSRGFDNRFWNPDSRKGSGPTKRFTKAIMKRISYPTPVLCISNVPGGKMSELKAYIIESGYTVKNLEHMPRSQNEGEPSKNNKEYALVEFASTEEAIGAVGKLHNTMPSNIGDKTKIRFSFHGKRGLQSNA